MKYKKRIYNCLQTKLTERIVVPRNANYQSFIRKKTQN